MKDRIFKITFFLSVQIYYSGPKNKQEFHILRPYNRYFTSLFNNVLNWKPNPGILLNFNLENLCFLKD